MVRLGEYDIRNETDCKFRKNTSDKVCAPKVQDFAVSPEDVTVHRNYNKTVLNGDDIALIRLERDADMSGGENSAHLPRNDYRSNAEFSRLREGGVLADLAGGQVGQLHQEAHGFGVGRHGDR